ncbi:hypothetical protein STCU_01050 [Strigomonas culicis]|uniref:Uncharacterized protein n=1 Tax=Strigomonas culicis TaxID=28005 RepID=S9V3P4_9TRYP|nr:hypothetical protein STCU_01050 [Strigomonas culicis]|eukprot:EPY35624.1 hypothetical protein STCU_01050 [Strigomonas culicis]
MTTTQFAKATKAAQLSTRQQQEELRDRLVLLRHGERQDHVDRSWKGNGLLPAHDPPLSNAGRMQALETAAHYLRLRKEKKVEGRMRGAFSCFLVSPFARCVETALIVNLVAYDGQLPILVEPLLSDWQQSKVFHAPPTLGGHYYLREEGAEMCFCPPTEALAASLRPFFRARVAHPDGLHALGLTAELAAAWEERLAGWLAAHEQLPVWTSGDCDARIREHIQLADELRQEQAEQPPQGHPQPQHHHHHKKGKGNKRCSQSPAPELTYPVHGLPLCGAPHPETKSDLARRCQAFVRTHFVREEDSVAMVPAAVLAAARQERRERLPKYFVSVEEPADYARVSSHSTEVPAVAAPQALLPPMFVLAVTHADVIHAVLEACCPRHHDDCAGFSAPYCSVSSVARYNNYYAIVPPELRASLGASGCGPANKKRRMSAAAAEGYSGARGAAPAASGGLARRGGGVYRETTDAHCCTIQVTRYL